eukprot:752444-Rhodomonas_salina.1
MDGRCLGWLIGRRGLMREGNWLMSEGQWLMSEGQWLTSEGQWWNDRKQAKVADGRRGVR